MQRKMCQKERIYLWDNLKVVLMVMVILTHCIIPYQDEKWTGYYWIIIMTFTMPLFTIISGFWYKKKSLNQNTRHLLYPCLLFSAINYIVGYKYYQDVAGGIDYLNVGYAMWYLWALYIYYNITPYLLKKLSLNKLIISSITIGIIVGYISCVGTKLALSRVLCFYPFFLIGILIRNKYSRFCYSNNYHTVGWICMILSIILYIILQTYKPGIVYYSGFMTGYFSHHIGGAYRLFTYVICIIMSLSMIAIMPNKKMWFSQYGSRTMNVYLLHMCIVFPSCWYICENIRHDLLAYIICLFIAPLLCCLLFCKIISRFMNRILLR